MFKHVRRMPQDPPCDGPVDILAEPRTGHDTKAIVAQLAEIGGDDVLEITEGFISARIDAAKLPELQAIAHVTVKARHQLK